MRVLFVISDLALHGAQKQVVELSRELARFGHEIAIYTLNADAPRARELRGSGVDVVVDQKRSRLDFSETGVDQAVYSVYRDLLRLRHEDAVFRVPNREATRSWTVGDDLLAIERRKGSAARLVLLNFGEDGTTVETGPDWQPIWQVGTEPTATAGGSPWMVPGCSGVVLARS